MNIGETIGATQQQQGSTSRAYTAGRCTTPISFLNVQNYKSLFNFLILYITVSKKEASIEMKIEIWQPTRNNLARVETSQAN